MRCGQEAGNKACQCCSQGFTTLSPGELQRLRLVVQVVLGDARITLARENPHAFGYLLIDAFSSDSIPVHLLTAEALSQYVDKLDADGLLAIHVSNRYLDLVPALAATLGQRPDLVAMLADDRRPMSGADAVPSQVVFVARKQSVIDRIAAWPDARALPVSSVRPWTDDYADVLGALARRLSR